MLVGGCLNPTVEILRPSPAQHRIVGFPLGLFQIAETYCFVGFSHGIYRVPERSLNSQAIVQIGLHNLTVSRHMLASAIEDVLALNVT